MDFLRDKLKIGSFYFYLAVIVSVVVIMFFITSNSDTTKSKLNENNITDMPVDSVHKNFNNLNSPTKANVLSSVFEKIDSLRREVDSHPKDITKLKELGDLLTASHKPKEAISYYNKIIEINPNNVEVLFSLSVFYNDDHNFSKAEECTNKILIIDPQNIQAKYNLGAINASKGNKTKARKIWEKLVKDYPNSEAANLAKSGLARL